MPSRKTSGAMTPMASVSLAEIICKNSALSRSSFVAAGFDRSILIGLR